MNVNINTKAATTSIKDFVKSHGGQVQHSEVLELLAGICGFDCYRALKAAEDAKPAPTPQLTPVQGQIRQTTFMPVVGRTLEDDTYVAFRSTMQDWELAHMDAKEQEAFQAYRRPRYDFVVEDFGSQFRVLVKPEGVGLDNFEGKPILDMLVEINDGVPCVHMTNDPADAMLLTVFATGEGLLTRSDDGEWGAASRDLPAAMEELVSRNCDERERHKSRVCLLDTRAKYAEDTPAVTPTVLSARAVLENPVDARFAFIKAMAEVKLEMSSSSDSCLMMTVGLVDEHGKETLVGQEDSPFPGSSSFVTAISPHCQVSRLEGYLSGAASLMAYLVAGGITIEGTATLMRKLANCEPNDPLSPINYALRVIGVGPDVKSVYKQLVTYVCAVE